MRFFIRYLARTCVARLLQSFWHEGYHQHDPLRPCMGDKNDCWLSTKEVEDLLMHCWKGFLKRPSVTANPDL